MTYPIIGVTMLVAVEDPLVFQTIERPTAVLASTA